MGATLMEQNKEPTGLGFAWKVFGPRRPRRIKPLEVNSPEANAEIRALTAADHDKPSLSLVVWFETIRALLILLVLYVLLSFLSPVWNAIVSLFSFAF